MDETLQGYFQRLDDYLSELGKSDSSVEYAPHIRVSFDMTVKSLNRIKNYLGADSKLIKDSDEYFR